MNWKELIGGGRVLAVWELGFLIATPQEKIFGRFELC